MKKSIDLVTILAVFVIFLAGFSMVSCVYIYVTTTNAQLAKISAISFLEASLVIVGILVSLKNSCFSKN